MFATVASDKPQDCSPGRFYSLYWRVLPFSWFFLFRDKRLRMRAPFNISFLITEIFGCEFVTKMLKNRLKQGKIIKITDCFLKQISDKIEFTLILNADKDFLKMFLLQIFVSNYVCLITMHLRRWLNQTINLFIPQFSACMGTIVNVWSK